MVLVSSKINSKIFDHSCPFALRWQVLNWLTMLSVYALLLSSQLVRGANHAHRVHENSGGVASTPPAQGLNDGIATKGGLTRSSRGRLNLESGPEAP